MIKKATVFPEVAYRNPKKEFHMSAGLYNQLTKQWWLPDRHLARKPTRHIFKNESIAYYLFISALT